MAIPITVNVETLTEEELQARFEEALEKVRWARDIFNRNFVKVLSIWGENE
jgi:hypothetical protein